jgi:hypothetical protein
MLSMPSAIMINVITHSAIVLNVLMLSVVMFSVVLFSVLMLSVVTKCQLSVSLPLQYDFPGSTVSLFYKCGTTQSCFNNVGHLLVCKQSKRGWEAQIFYPYFVMSQLYETKIP